MEDVVMDMGNVKFVDVAEMTVLNPETGELTKWVWQVAGPSHPESVALGERQTRRAQMEALQQARRGGRQKLTDLPDPKEARQQLCEDLACRVLGWNGPIVLNGERHEYSKAKVVQLISDPGYGWLFQQYVDYLTADSSFLKGSVLTS